jgi:hypothetical protein
MSDRGTPPARRRKRGKVEITEEMIEATESLPHAGLADRIAEIIVQHTGMYGVSAHGIALEILALMKEDRRRANNSPIR